MVTKFDDRVCGHITQVISHLRSRLNRYVLKAFLFHGWPFSLFLLFFILPAICVRFLLAVLLPPVPYPTLVLASRTLVVSLCVQQYTWMPDAFSSHSYKVRYTCWLTHSLLQWLLSKLDIAVVQGIWMPTVVCTSALVGNQKGNQLGPKGITMT